jgi:hypothetical protein
MEEEKLQMWLSSMAGMIIWMKEHGYSAEETLGTLNHDIQGINATMYRGMELFSPRSTSYEKYCPDKVKCAGKENQCTCSTCIPPK